MTQRSRPPRLEGFAAPSTGDQVARKFLRERGWEGGGRQGCVPSSCSVILSLICRSVDCRLSCLLFVSIYEVRFFMWFLTFTSCLRPSFPVCDGSMTPPVVKATQGKQDGSRQQHFRRGGSRVYYASETGCWPANSLPKNFWIRSKCLGESVVPEISEEASSSGEEAGEEEVSPGGLFRGYLRGSPSHRSQDSGYSDSGESTNAHNDTDSLPTTPLNVKHITRVYFGENPHLFNDKIVSVPKINIITTSGSVTSPPGDAPAPDEESLGTQLRPHHQHGQTDSLEELPEELEHKSVLEAATKRTGAVRKRPVNSAALTVPRRLQRRSSSAEKLLTDGQIEQHRRQTGLSRARRRWSLGEAPAPVSARRQQQGTPSYVTSGTNTHASLSQLNRKPKVELMSRGVDTSSLECAEDRSGLRLAGDTNLRAAVSPSPTHTHPARTHPVAVAREMR